jgi:ubiquinone/menaquinone biosynthesis C-methylase UbiE
LPFRDASLDFVIASQVLKRVPSPPGALRHWFRVLEPGGILVLQIPDKRFTFDFRRKSAVLQHLIEEDARPDSFVKPAHFRDWVASVVGLPTEECRLRTRGRSIDADRLQHPLKSFAH